MIKFVILVGNKTYIENKLEELLKEVDAHSLMILGFDYDANSSEYHILVRFRDKGSMYD